MNPRLILGGLKSYLPVRLSAYTGTGGTTTGAYCYSVWMRHLSIIDRHVRPFHSDVVVELGPGDSIGLGLAALLAGAERYYGLDVLEHASVQTNERVLDELVELFRERAPIPGDVAFPRLLPRLPSYAYPSGLFDETVLNERLSECYVSRLRAAIRNMGGHDSPIHYSCPWSAQSVASHAADLVISQGALQDMDHVPSRDDLRNNMETMASWLKPGGVMSHQIEFSCPGGAEWNHHWAYGSLTWKLIRGNRPYYKNRVPLSEYLRLFDAVGCDVVGVEPVVADGLPRDQLASPFKDLPDADLQTRAALVVAIKR
jgi:predicted RNA methylase